MPCYGRSLEATAALQRSPEIDSIAAQMATMGSPKRASMRQVIVGLLAIAVSSCTRTDLSDQHATALVALARELHIDATASGTRVTLAGAEVNLEARIEQEAQQGPQWLVGIAVTIGLPAGVNLTAGSIGVGTTRQDAIDTAVTEWGQLIGVAILKGVALKERSVGVIARNGFLLYPGATGFRGPEHPTLSDDQHARLVQLITPELAGLAAGRLHELSLAVAVKATGEVDGDCQLDGASSQSILNAVKTFSWPKLKTPYMFKRYYLVEKTT